MSLVEHLYLARALLVVHGRAVGRFEDDERRVCLLAAVARATVGDDDAYLQTVEALCRYIPASTNPNLPKDERIWHFNDDRQTNDQDIFDVIDKALADLGGLG